MKLNIANPNTGAQKLLDIDDEKKLRIFYDKRMSQEVKGDDLGEEFKGYVFKISGGNDKQGFPMKQGILVNKRVRLLFSKGHSCYRPRRSGERQRKSVRGCIVGQDLAVLSLVVVKSGVSEIPGLDKNIPRRLGPKRASKIRKLFNLSKADDVRKFVVRREIPPKEGKKKGTSKAPKIQRLVTPITLQRKRRRLALKKRWSLKSKKDATEYQKLLQTRLKESKEKRLELINKKRGVTKPATTTPATPLPVTDKKTKAVTDKKAVTPADTTKKAPVVTDTSKKTKEDVAAESKKAAAKAPVKSEAPKTETPKVDPKAVAPKTDPKAVAPKVDPKAVAPKTDTSKADSSKKADPKVDTGKKAADVKVDSPKTDTGKKGTEPSKAGGAPGTTTTTTTASSGDAGKKDAPKTEPKTEPTKKGGDSAKKAKK